MSCRRSALLGCDASQSDPVRGDAALRARLVGREALLIFEQLYDVDHVAWIVVDAGQVLGTKLVGLQFLRAAVFRDVTGCDTLRCLRRSVGRALKSAAFEDDTQDACGENAQSRRLLASGALRGVPRRHMADLVADDAGQVGFALHVSHDAAGHVHIAARQREGVDVRTVENREVPLEPRAVRILGQPLAEVIDVGLQLRIVVFAELGEDLRVRLRPFCDFGGLVHDRVFGLAGNGIHDRRAASQRCGE